MENEEIMVHKHKLQCVYVFAVRRLLLCEELDRSSCGSVLFHGYLPSPGKDMKLSNRENEIRMTVLVIHRIIH